MRTLIVDDSPIIRILLQRMLTRYGECASAADGQEAVDVYRRSLSQGSPFDLVCLDLGLHGISGTSVLGQLRAVEAQHGSAAKARVLVITASSAEADVDAVRRHGADGYMVKPINKEKLAEYIKAFGFVSAPAIPEPVENSIQRFEEMCGLDTIPVAVLTRLIQRMAGSIGRQLAGLTAQSASTTTK